jgi:glycosyltransferase involved in cell wall biosynthesis
MHRVKGANSKISIVAPLYNEEEVIDELIDRLRKTLDEIGLPYEIVLVNDGSRDRTLEMAKGYCAQDRRIKLVGLSRNFGHQVAVTAGLAKATGEVVVIIDADLQDPPEVIKAMVEKWREGYDVVYGVRTRRQGEGFFKLITAKLFYRLLKRLTAVDIPVDTGDFRLMDRKVVDELNRMTERNRFLRGMVSWLGFRQTCVEYVRDPRYGGESKYPLLKMISFAADGIFSFSRLPLRISSVFGLFCSAVSFLFIIYGLAVRILFPSYAISGWASIFLAILFLGGVQLLTVGILGEYIGRIYEEVKGRQLFVVGEEYNFDGE